MSSWRHEYSAAGGERATLLDRRRAELRMVSRTGWGAEPPRGRYAELGRERAIVLHHTSWPSRQLADAGVGEESAYVRAVQRSHLDRDFIDIGYHFLIMPSGRAFAGRPRTAMGAHVRGHNDGTIAIAMAGDFDVEEPTDRALASLWALVTDMENGAPLTLLAHRDLADTTCPGESLLRRVELPATAAARRRLSAGPAAAPGSLLAT